jgi:hypothetical protein
MDAIDLNRGHPIFNDRLRKEWIDTFTWRYILKGGEIGG